MEYNPLEEASPFAPFWHGGSHALEADAPTSLDNFPSQSSQHKDDDTQQETHTHRPDEQVDAPAVVSQQDPMRLSPPTASLDQPEFHENGSFMDSESASNASEDHPKVQETEDAERSPSALTPEELLSAPLSEDSPVGSDDGASAVQAEPHHEELTSNLVERETSSPLTSAPLATESISPQRSPAMSSGSLSEKDEPAGNEEDQVALESQIQNEAMVSSPLKLPELEEDGVAVDSHGDVFVEPTKLTVPTEPMETTERVLDGPFEGQTGTADAGVDFGESYADAAKAVASRIESSAVAIEKFLEPQAVSAPALQPRSQSASEALQSEDKEQPPHEVDETIPRRTSAPALMEVRLPSFEKPFHLATPGREAKQTPGKRGRPKKSDAIGALTSSAAKRHKTVKTPVRAMPSRLASRPATVSGRVLKTTPASVKQTRLPKSAAKSPKAAKATPASVKQTRLPKSAAKSPKVPETSDTPKRRGRPPKSAAATLSSVPPTTPASQRKRQIGGGRISGVSGGSAKPLGGSTQRKTPSSRTSVRVLKQTPVRSSKLDLPASGARRGRPPKDAKAQDIPEPLKSEEKRKSGRGTPFTTVIGALPKTAKPEAETARTKAGIEPKEETPVTRRGRQPAVKVAGKPGVSATGRGSRQTKSIASQESRSMAEDSAPVKRRGRPPRTIATSEPDPAPKTQTVKAVKANAGKSRKPVEMKVSSEPIIKQRGRPAKAASNEEAPPRSQTAKGQVELNAGKKRGRPTRTTIETIEEPSTKRRRIQGSTKDETAAKDKESTKSVSDHVAPAGRKRGRPAEAVKVASVDKTTAFSEVKQEMGRGRGRGRGRGQGQGQETKGKAMAAVEEAAEASQPPARGRPGRKTKASEPPMEAKTKRQVRPERPKRGSTTEGPVRKAAHPRGITKKPVAPRGKALEPKAKAKANEPQRQTRSRRG